MQGITIEPGKNTPGVSFNPETNILEFSGYSYPSNPAEFYEPLIDWVRNYLEVSAKQSIMIVFKLRYFNTSTSHFLYKFFELFNELPNKKKKLKIQYYDFGDDEDSFDSWRSLLYDLDLEYETINVDDQS